MVMVLPSMVQVQVKNIRISGVNTDQFRSRRRWRTCRIRIVVKSTSFRRRHLQLQNAPNFTTNGAQQVQQQRR